MAKRLSLSSIKRLSLLLMSMMIVMSVLSPITVYATDNHESKTVTIGWYYSDLFQEGMSDEEQKSGYSYEYIQKIANYNGWNYKYVYGGWTELFTMLEAGEIDLLAGVAKTDERLDKFLYPNEVMGYENYVLYKHADDRNLDSSDLATLSGKKLGGITNNLMTERLAEWLKENNIDAEIVYYDDFEERDQEFAEGKLDALVTTDNNVMLSSGYSKLVKVGEEAYYLAVTMGRADILYDLNHAMEHMQDVEPYFIENLEARNYGATLANSTLSLHEEDWLNEHCEITIGYLNNYLPYCTTDENGNVYGLVTDVIDASFEKMNIKERLNVKYRSYDNGDDMIAALNTGEIDVAFPVDRDTWQLEKYGIKATNDVVTSNVDLIYRGNYNEQTVSKIAVTSGNIMMQHYIESVFPDAELVEYDSTSACLNAVLNGDAGSTTINGLRVDIVKKNRQYDALSYKRLEKTTSRCFGVAAESSELYILLNRGLNLIGQDFATNASYSYMIDLYEVTVYDFVVDHIGLFGCIVTLIIAGIVFAVVRSHNKTKKYLRLEEEKNRELTKRQEQLEGATAEQEAQVEEITALNAELQENHLELERQLAVINATSQRYFCAYTFDVDKRTFHEVFTLPNMHALLGSNGNAEKPLETAWKHLVVPEDQEIMRNFHNISKWKEYLTDCDIYSVEYRGVTSGWSRASLFVAGRDADGSATRVVYTLEKIHEQKETELTLAAQVKKITELNENLEEYQAKLEEVAAEQESQLDEITILNQQLKEKQLYTDLLYHRLMKVQSCGIVAYKVPSQEMLVMNDMARKLYDLSIDGDLENDDFIKHISKVRYDNPEITKARLHSIKHPGEQYSFSFWISHKDGTDVHVHTTTQLIQMDNGDLVVISSMQDISEITELYKTTEQEKAANSAKTSFLFSMSHDIRTPMNAIIGYTDLIEKHFDEKEKCKDYLEKVKRANSFLLSLINNVLEMARIESGKVTLDEKPCRMLAIQDEIGSVYSELMHNKGVRFTQTADVKTQYVFADPVKVKQVFLNLVSNAYKYTNAGGEVTLAIEELPSDQRDQVLMKATVSDTGMGMSKDYLPVLFEEFSREQSVTDNKIEGTGLGMPIVKCLVDLMNGTIDVESELGKGTTFVVTIPFRVAEKAMNQNTADEEIDPERFIGKRILLAEDNDLNAEIATEVLTEFGFVIERAEDGAVCVDMLKKAEAGYYDVVLMDVQMPHLDGYEATKQIRAFADKAKADIPILAMTANAFEEDKQSAYNAGMNGHLAKPIEIKQLMIALADNLK